MNYKNTIDNYQIYFKAEYGKFISNLIKEVEKECFPIDYSIYTSKIANEAQKIAKQFLKSEQIEDHSITNNIKDFRLDLSYYLEVALVKEERMIESALFNAITNQNIKLNK